MGWGTVDMRMNNPKLRYWYSKSEINPALMRYLFDVRCSQAEIDQCLRSCYVGVCVTGSAYYTVRHTKCYDVKKLGLLICHLQGLEPFSER